MHRDIKPANIFLSAPRRRGSPFTVKVLDFGIAKAVADNKLTGTTPLGTPLYMAPEQMENAASVTPAADVWSLGLVAFRVLTGTDFWRSANDTFAALVREVVVAEVPFASVRARELGVTVTLPPGFDAWFARCLARQIEARFANAGEAIRAFMDLVPPDAKSGRVAEWLHESVGAAPESSLPSGAGSAAVSGLQETAFQEHSAPGRDDGAPTPAQRSAETTDARPVATTASAGGSLRVGALVAGVAALGAAAYFLLARSTVPGATPPVASPSAVPAAALAPSVAAAPALPACPDGMVLISGGNMFMGDVDLANARPPHKVTVPAFCVDRNEVTAGGYDACVGGGNCLKSPQDVQFTGVTPEQRTAFAKLCNTRQPERATHPMNCVDWGMADNFCRTAGGRLEKGGARLPREAEWEFAARGSSQRTYPWGDEPPDPLHLNACGSECAAWFEKEGLQTRTLHTSDDGFPGTAPVGSFPAGKSDKGLLDLAGNVWEWTADWHAPYTEGARDTVDGPPAGTERVVRGGAFNGSAADWAKPAYRWKTTPDVYNHAIGFRCAADPAR